MSLGWKAFVVAFLAVLLFVLKIFTARKRFGSFFEEHRRRRERVPVGAEHASPLNDSSHVNDSTHLSHSNPSNTP